MATSAEIEAFLQDFKAKISIWPIIYRDDRGKNLQTLLDLEINGTYRTKIITELESSDYFKGPQTDTLNRGTDLWIFKKKVKGHEVYIKITLGELNKMQFVFHSIPKRMKHSLKGKLL